MTDVAIAIDAEAITLARITKSGGSYNQAGDWTGESTNQTSFQAVIQPTTGATLRDLPEGERSEARYTLWTRTEISLDDQIVYLDKTYRVIFLWPRPEGNYFKAVLGQLRPNVLSVPSDND